MNFVVRATSFRARPPSSLLPRFISSSTTLFLPFLHRSSILLLDDKFFHRTKRAIVAHNGITFTIETLLSSHLFHLLLLLFFFFFFFFVVEFYTDCSLLYAYNCSVEERERERGREKERERDCRVLGINRTLLVSRDPRCRVSRYSKAIFSRREKVTRWRGGGGARVNLAAKQHTRIN